MSWRHPFFNQRRLPPSITGRPAQTPLLTPAPPPAWTLASEQEHSMESIGN
ncbi:hypothetical protein SACS_0724 [Parasaccharibacter apium]|uniref:Uncharacterized protein n=1 Tax=Parasaccharibacter apium TaxID=1510841 RepID=A0A7U7G5C9_9PROT|nr:hypothetical protein SACS_0724 [Parasaccharibacter apium]